MRALLREVVANGLRVVIPAGALGQVWRNAAKQVALGALCKAPTTAVTPLDQVLAEAAGVLCGKTKTSDVIDASVVLTARQERGVIVTSELDDLRHLDKAVELHRI